MPRYTRSIRLCVCVRPSKHQFLHFLVHREVKQSSCFDGCNSTPRNLSIRYGRERAKRSNYIDRKQHRECNKHKKIRRKKRRITAGGKEKLNREDEEVIGKVGEEEEKKRLPVPHLESDKVYIVVVILCCASLSLLLFVFFTIVWECSPPFVSFHLHLSLSLLFLLLFFL